MRKIALIPARMASTRFPNKPLYLLNRKAMIHHVYDRAKQCPSLDEVHICSGDKEIWEYCQTNDISYIPTFKEHASGTDRIYEAVKTLDLTPNDLILNIQGDMPYIPENALRVLLLAIETEGECIATLEWTKQFPLISKQTDHNGCVNSTD